MLKDWGRVWNPVVKVGKWRCDCVCWCLPICACLHKWVSLIDSTSSSVDSVWLSWRCECTLLAAFSICHHLEPVRWAGGRPSDQRAPVCLPVILLLACTGTPAAPKNTHLMETNPLILLRVSVTKAVRAMSYGAMLCQVWPSKLGNQWCESNLGCKWSNDGSVYAWCTKKEVVQLKQMLL